MQRLDQYPSYDLLPPGLSVRIHSESYTDHLYDILMMKLIHATHLITSLFSLPRLLFVLTSQLWNEEVKKVSILLLRL